MPQRLPQATAHNLFRRKSTLGIRSPYDVYHWEDPRRCRRVRGWRRCSLCSVCDLAKRGAFSLAHGFRSTAV